MSKDRAAPFSRKHRRYWIPVTGGMILIGLINLALGWCSYTPPQTPERINLVLPPRDAAAPATDATGTVGASQLPAAVMRAFAVKYPRTIPSGANVLRDAAGSITFVLDFPPGAAHHHATFRDDGAFVSDD